VCLFVLKTTQQTVNGATASLASMADASSESGSEEAPGEDQSDVDEEAKGEVELTAEGEWGSKQNDNFEAMMTARMNAVYEQEDVVQMHPSARNTGSKYAEVRAQPLAPQNGFYDERYVCATRPAGDMDEDTDFEFMKGSEDDGVVPPERVTFAFKGVQDYTLEMIARFLDETNQDHGDTIKRWRQQGKGIKKLWLNDNPITAAGVAFLAAALQNNSTLEELYLHYTNCNDVGLGHLLEMLGKNKTLKKLELGNSGITEKGAGAIVKAFSKGGSCQKNSTLEHMGLFGNADSIDNDLPVIADLLEKESRDSRK